MLNTGPYSTASKAPPLDPTLHPDPYGQLAWLETELMGAARRGAQLLILATHYYHSPLASCYYC